jgi:hypothetical protein
MRWDRGQQGRDRVVLFPLAGVGTIQVGGKFSAG